MAFSYKTSITFGLVYIPIKLHAVVKQADISFNQIDRETGSRVKYQKTCELCGGRLVDKHDIIKGYEYQKGKYVHFDNADFEKIKTQKDKTIAIERFVDLAQIDPVYFDRSFYVAPEKSAGKACSLLTSAMEKEGKVALAKTVLGSKEVLIAIRARGGKMILSTMHFYDEIQESPVAAGEPTNENELSLAKTIISGMEGSFEPEKYKDEYRQRLLDAIEAKIAGKAIEVTDEGVKTKKVTDLMEALKLSLEQIQKKNPSKKRAN